jgi:hypothetical protein
VGCARLRRQKVRHPWGAMWKRLKAERQYEQALDTLSRLHVVPGGASGQLSLNPTFRTSMRQAMTGG